MSELDLDHAIYAFYCGLNLSDIWCFCTQCYNEVIWFTSNILSALIDGTEANVFPFIPLYKIQFHSCIQQPSNTNTRNTSSS